MRFIEEPYDGYEYDGEKVKDCDIHLCICYSSTKASEKFPDLWPFWD
ncbi:MAG: hypothetical protein ACP5EQ_08375 [Candidatus Cloacimonadia bacterium]